jgi:hypothetical protein
MVFFLILIASAYVQYTLPWWTLGLAPFAVAAMQARSGRVAFWSGFGALFLLWGGLALFRAGELAERVAATFGLPHALLLVALTALIGALTGGLAAWAGYWCRRAVWPRPAPKKAVTSA